MVVLSLANFTPTGTAHPGAPQGVTPCRWDPLVSGLRPTGAAQRGPPLTLKVKLESWRFRVLSLGWNSWVWETTRHNLTVKYTTQKTFTVGWNRTRTARQPATNAFATHPGTPVTRHTHVLRVPLPGRQTQCICLS
jgi:hypothetical protein